MDIFKLHKFVHHEFQYYAIPSITKFLELYNNSHEINNKTCNLIRSKLYN